MHLDEPAVVPASEYDALCDLFRGICQANGYDEREIRDFMRGDYDDVAIEWAVEVAGGATARDLGIVLKQEARRTHAAT